jgi:REP-associated tyrosine transposase
MSRPLRIEYEGALYHVMNRGNQRQDVFLKKIDCETFLEKLEHFADLFQVEIYCYCLMTNHFHLLLKTNEANLGRFMQSLLTSFTITQNRRNLKSGHLFQGRYKAHLVEGQRYLSELSRYIHLNPVRIKRYEKSSVKARRNIIANYTWSSFAAYIGLTASPELLDITPVLSTWGKSDADRMKNYSKYVEDALCKRVDNPFETALRQQIIGSESFAEKIMRGKILNKKVKDAREERALIHFKKSIHPKTVIEVVSEYYRVTKTDLLQRKGSHREARKLATYLCCKHCTSHTSLTGMGKLFGISLSGLTRSRDKVEQGMKDDIGLSNKIETMEKSILHE